MDLMESLSSRNKVHRPPASLCLRERRGPHSVHSDLPSNCCRVQRDGNGLRVESRKQRGARTGSPWVRAESRQKPPG
eukprot:3502683-Pleurochrysis_carterae.AAC.2